MIHDVQILFKAGVHPEAPANALDHAAFDRVWRHSVLLLQRGFKTGSILTVDPEEAQKLGAQSWYCCSSCCGATCAAAAVHHQIDGQRAPTLQQRNEGVDVQCCSTYQSTAAVMA